MPRCTSTLVRPQARSELVPRIDLHCARCTSPSILGKERFHYNDIYPSFSLSVLSLSVCLCGWAREAGAQACATAADPLGATSSAFDRTTACAWAHTETQVVAGGDMGTYGGDHAGECGGGGDGSDHRVCRRAEGGTSYRVVGDWGRGLYNCALTAFTHFPRLRGVGEENIPWIRYVIYTPQEWLSSLKKGLRSRTEPFRIIENDRIQETLYLNRSKLKGGVLRRTRGRTRDATAHPPFCKDPPLERIPALLNQLLPMPRRQPAPCMPVSAHFAQLRRARSRCSLHLNSVAKH